MSRFVSTLTNAVPMAVLASPLHPIMSSRYALLSFTGRKTGRRFTFPIAYVTQGDSAFISTDSRWWVNLREGAVCTLRIRGRKRTGAATHITGIAAVTALTELVKLPGYARAARIPRSNGTIATETIEAHLSGPRPARRVIRIELDVDRNQTEQPSC